MKIELEKEITLKKLEEINLANNKFNKIKNQIESLSEYVNLDNEGKSRIKNEIEKNIQELQKTDNILSISAIFNNFEQVKFPSLIKSLVKNNNQNIIASSSLRLKNKKLILESEEDVHEYIDKYKNAILEEIRLGNKIQI